ncbi:hypothetical protein ES703_66263 [subsurface metagenome]
MTGGLGVIKFVDNFIGINEEEIQMKKIKVIFILSFCMVLIYGISQLTFARGISEKSQGSQKETKIYAFGSIFSGSFLNP